MVYGENPLTKGIIMPRIRLKDIDHALVLVQDVCPDMLIFNGPCYMLVIDGEVNIVYDVNPYKTHTADSANLLKYLRKQKIPAIWR